MGTGADASCTHQERLQSPSPMELRGHRRPIGALVIACLAAFAVLNLWSESDSGSTESISLSLSESDTTISGQGKMSSVMQGILDLKAFSLSAWKKAKKIQKGQGLRSRHRLQGGGSSGLVDFVVAFGKVSKKHPDPVTEYASTMGHLRSRFRIGLRAYLLDSMPSAILTGKGAIIVTNGGKRGTYAKLNHRHLGFQGEPAYLAFMKVRLSAFQESRRKLHGFSAKKALKAWILHSEKTSYRTFLTKITAKWRRLQYLQDLKEEAGAQWSENKSWKYALRQGKGEQAQLMPMPPAGAAGGAQVRKKSTFFMPSPAALKKQAMKMAARYVKGLRRATASEIVRAMEAKLEGVTLRFSTAKHELAGSDQSPKVKVVGTHGTAKGILKALPLRGGTSSQTLTMS